MCMFACVEGETGVADSPPPVSRGWRVGGGEAVSGARLLEGCRDLPLSSEDLSVCVCAGNVYI